MLNRTLTPTKWLSLACLLGGIAVVQLTGPSSHEDKLLDVTMHASNFGESRLSGLLAALAGCTSSFHVSRMPVVISDQDLFDTASGFAGVYIEQLIKSSSTDLWTRNAQLSLWSLPAAYIAALQAGGAVQQLSHLRSAPATASVGLFTGIKGWALVTVLFQAVGGLLTALVLKFANTIAKSTRSRVPYAANQLMCGVENRLCNFAVGSRFLPGRSDFVRQYHYARLLHRRYDGLGGDLCLQSAR